MEKNPLDTTTAAATGAATGAVVMAVVIPLIIKVGSELKQKFYDFGDDQMGEINQIRYLYRNFCWQHEKNTSLSTNFIGLESTDESNRDFPIYFQMDPNSPKQPMFFSKKFQTIMEAERWNAYVANSILSNVPGGIKDMIGNICNYQNERNKGCLRITEKVGIGGKGYYYDPTNLFFEEFKRWLVELSKAKIDEKTLEIVEGRMNYLRKIDVNDVFQQSSRVVTRRETVIMLLNNLSNTVRPIIVSTLAAQGSREHYNNLGINISGLIRATAQFCFYIFRDTEETPANFILDQMEKATGIYKKILTETRSGKLLNQLYSCQLYKMIKAGDNNSGLSQFKLEFSGDMSKLFSDNKEYEKIAWGILPEFRSHAILLKFYSLHGLIEKLYVFQKIANDLYGLAGQGGDVLVYGCLSEQTQHVMQNYRALLRDVEVTIRELHSIADAHRHKLVEKKKDCSRDELRWVGLFKNADEAFEQLCYRWSRPGDYTNNADSLIGQSLRLIRKIEKKMDEVNTPEYKADLIDKINRFSRWMVLFSGGDISLDVSNEEKKPVKQVAAESMVVDIQNSAKHKPFHLSIENSKYQFLLEEVDPRADNLFFFLGSDVNACISQVLEVCKNEPFVHYLSEEAVQVFHGIKLPGHFKSIKTNTPKLGMFKSSKSDFDKYQTLVEEGKIEESLKILRTLFVKSKKLLIRYVQFRYLQLKSGVPYKPGNKGMLHVLAELLNRECYILEIVDGHELRLLEHIECLKAKTSPVYLLCSSNDPAVDYPLFQRLVDLRYRAELAHRNSDQQEKRSSTVLVEDVNESSLLQEAEQDYQASQVKSLKRTEWTACLNNAVRKIDILLSIDQKNPLYHMLRGKYLASTGDHANRERALVDFGLALRFCNKENKKLMCEILFERGKTLDFINRVDDALSDFKEILNLDSNHVNARYAIANIYFQKNDFPNAIDHLNYVIKNTKDSEILFNSHKLQYLAAKSIGDLKLTYENAAAVSNLKPEDDDLRTKKEEAFSAWEESANSAKKK